MNRGVGSKSIAFRVAQEQNPSNAQLWFHPGQLSEGEKIVLGRLPGLFRNGYFLVCFPLVNFLLTIFSFENND